MYMYMQYVHKNKCAQFYNHGTYFRRETSTEQLTGRAVAKLVDQSRQVCQHDAQLLPVERVDVEQSTHLRHLQ